MIVALPDMQATASFGAALAPLLRAGDTVLLEGALGAGKTALARAIIQARLAADTGAGSGADSGASSGAGSGAGGTVEEVPSPSFTLVQVYGAAPEIWHCDLYRLHSAEEVEELGLADAFDRALVLIEWPDRLGPLCPARHLRVALADAPDAASAMPGDASPPGSARKGQAGPTASVGMEEPGRLARLSAQGPGWEALLDRAADWQAAGWRAA